MRFYAITRATRCRGGDCWGTLRKQYFAPWIPYRFFGCHPCRVSYCKCLSYCTHNPKVGGSNPPPATKTLFSAAALSGLFCFSCEQQFMNHLPSVWEPSGVLVLSFRNSCEQILKDCPLQCPCSFALRFGVNVRVHVCSQLRVGMP